MRYRRLIFLGLVVAIFLSVREWFDRVQEDVRDQEIIREDLGGNDAHLGSWGQANKNAIIQFRLKRDGRFNYEVVTRPDNDTIRHAGWYNINSDFKLVAVSDNGDTIINHGVYLTQSANGKVDVMNLVQNNDDTAAMLFYRLKQ